MQPPATTHNHLQPSTTTHNYPQPPTTIHNHQQPPTTIHNYPQPPKKPPITIHNHPKVTQKAKTCHKQLCYSTLYVNTETYVGFDSDTKQWYIYMRVCLFVYIFCKTFIYYFFVRVIVFLSVFKSNSFDVKTDERCLF